MIRAYLICVLAFALTAVSVGCGSRHYNPYVGNDSRRPVGKTIEDTTDSLNRGLNYIDSRFENWYH